MDSCGAFNPRARLAAPKLFVEPSSSIIRAELPKPSEQNTQQTQLTEFMKKSMEFKNKKISIEEYRKELVRWFPLLNGLGQVKLDVNVIVGGAGMGQTSTDVSFLSAQVPSRIEEPSRLSPEKQNFAGFLPPEDRSVDEDDQSFSAQRIRRQVIASQVRKIRSFWSATNSHIPHTFKKKGFFRSRLGREQVLVELVDMGCKAIKNG